MISIITVQDLGNSRYIFGCAEVVNTNNCKEAVKVMRELERNDRESDFYLTKGDWSHADFWPHNKASIRNEHIKVINHYNCEE